jgi:polar amino acid transport system substrate-binding protein
MTILKIFLLVILSIISINASNLKKVSLQLQWKYQFQFAGYIMAKEKGFYKDAGIDIDIKEWRHGIDMVDEVITENSEYAVSRPTSLIDISNGKEIVYLATIYQSSPLILLTDKSLGIKTIKDFKNKRIMTTGDLNNDSSILSMLYSQGVKIDDFIVQQPTFNVKDLLNNKTDLIASYISNEPFILKQLGGNPIIFRPKDYGFDFYNDLVITSKKHLEKNPIEVKNFRDASLKGWEYSFSNIEETVNVIFTKYNTQNKTKEALQFEANALKKLAYDKTTKIGKVKIEKLEKISDVYRLLGLIKKNINFNQIIYHDNTEEIRLSTKEKEYLNKRSEIKMCIDPNWMPYEKFAENGEYIGMTSEYYKLFGKILNKDFIVVKTDSWTESLEYIKKRKCDILSLAMETPERKKNMNFTSPYLTTPLVITTKINMPFINDIKEISNKEVGISKGYAFAELLKKEYPYLNIVEVNNIDDGLKKVNNGDIFAYVGTLASVGYKLQNKYFGELKIAGKISDNWELGIGVRDDDTLLLSILQKAINTISYNQKQSIFNNWISIKYEKGVDYKLLYAAILIFILILLIILYFYNKQNQLKYKLEIAYANVQRLAITDKLTNLYNRHKLDESLVYEKKRSDRYSITFGVMILDIDWFKRVNDKYGHLIGDVVLKEFSYILKSNSRETDIIGRWGGEEFLIIVPQSNKSSLLEYAKNLKDKVDSTQFNTIGHLTVSIGITLYKVKESTENVVERADNALYSAKKNGRNMIYYIEE